MNEQTDAPEQGGSEDQAIADASITVEINSDDTAEQQTGADEPGQADETGDAPKRKPWWEKRFDELTAKRYQAEQDAAYWRGIAEASGGQQQAMPAHQEGPPKEDQFASYEDYEQARIEHAVEQRLGKLREAEQRNSVLRSYEERVARFSESKADYSAVVNNPALKITPVMAEVIRESDAGPEVAYHLGTNPQEAARIASLPQHRQAAELGKLEARLSAPAPTPAPSATNRLPHNPPPKTVAGLSVGAHKAPEDMSMAEYVAARNAGTI